MRTTVASLVPVSSARPVTVRAAQPAGSAATASATRCMERVIDGRQRAHLGREGGGGGRGGRRGPPLRVACSSCSRLKISFTSLGHIMKDIFDSEAYGQELRTMGA